MPSNELQRCANSVESAKSQIINGLRQIEAAVKYYNANELGTELATLQDSDLVVTTGNGITKKRMVQSAIFGASALFHVFGVTNGTAGQTLLGAAPLTSAQLDISEDGLAI